MIPNIRPILAILHIFGFVETLCWILYIFHFASIRPLKNDYREGFQQSHIFVKIPFLFRNRPE